MPFRPIRKIGRACPASVCSLAPWVRALHRVGRRHAEQPESVANDDLRGARENQARVAQLRIVYDDLMRAVIRVEIVRQIAQIMHERMRRSLEGALLDDLWIEAQALDQRLFLRL